MKWATIAATGLVVSSIAVVISEALSHGFHAGLAAARAASAGAPPSVTAVVPAPLYAPVFPNRPPASGDQSVEIYDTSIEGSGPGLPMRVRLYLPAGHHEPASLPCVFIAPAGTPLIYGSALSSSDSPEHLPYARAGFAVLAYELSGDVPGEHARVTYGELEAPVRQFMAADGGLANARAAIDYVLQKVPEADPARLYCAGHSSAATVALDVAASDFRIRGDCAYAPACFVDRRMAAMLPRFEPLVPGFTNFATRASPANHIATLNCPIFLFHADDDTNVPLADIQEFADDLKAAGKTVDFKRVPTGGHYESMISQGVPAGSVWLTEHGALPKQNATTPPSPHSTP